MQSQQRELTDKQIEKLLQICQQIPHLGIEKGQDEQLDAQLYSQLQKNIHRTRNIQFQHLSIQCFYVLYACLQNNIFPQLHQEFIAYSNQHQSPILLFSKMIANKDISSMMNIQCPYFTLYYRILKQIIILLTKADTKSNKMVENQGISQIKHEEIEDCSTQKFNQYLSDVGELLQKNIADQQCFIELEKTSFIREQSIIYSLRNYALSIIVSKDTILKQNLQKYHRQEKQLLLEFRQKKMLHKKYHEQYQVQTQIHKNFTAFITQSFKNNPMNIRITNNLTDTLTSHNNQDISELKFLENLQHKFKIKALHDTPQHLKNRAGEQKNRMIECYLEYVQEKSTLIVKLNCDLILESQFIIEVLYKWSMLTFDAGLISLQLHEKSQFQRKIKHLYIKGKTEITYNESMIISAMKLIDITIAAFLSIQHWVKNTSDEQIRSNSIKKMNQSYKRVLHYVNIANRLSQHIYSGVL